MRIVCAPRRRCIRPAESALRVALLLTTARAFSPIERGLHRRTGLRPSWPVLRSSTRSAEVPKAADAPSAAPVDAVVCGGGPAGLLTAIMLAQKFPERKVKVFDRLSPPPSPTDEAVWSDVAKFYLIGIGYRGQKALKKFGVWEDVKACSNPAVGRKDWAPDAKPEEGVERIFTDRPAITEVIARDRLVGCLYKHIQDKYHDQIELNYGFEVTPIDFGAGEDSFLSVRVSKCNPGVAESNPTHMLKAEDEPKVLCDAENSFTLSTEFLVGADGTARTIASAVEADDRAKRDAMSVIEKFSAGKPLTVTRYMDDNRRTYKTIPLKVPPDWRTDLNYSARSKDGRVTFDALPADGAGNYCGVLLLREDDEMARADSDPAKLRKLLDEFLPQFSNLLDDAMVATIAKKPPSYLPSFRFVGPRLNQGARCVLLGDCAHTVKPYFGLGVNTAFEDVEVLGEAFDSTSSISEAVHLFSDRRAKEAEVIVKLSHGLDRPGTLGTLQFIVPLILDSVFHGIAPSFFAPNTLAMFQKEGVTFQGIRRRKWIDRFGQIAVLGVVFSSLGMASNALVDALAKLTGQGISTVVASLAATAAAFFVLRKAGFLLLPGLAPADVMPKTKDKVTNSDTFITPLGFDKGKGEGRVT